jgi:putative two-component system response regulator
MPAADHLRPTPDAAHRDTVLVVDDEPAVQRFLSRLLGTQGYTVECAGDGDSALRAIAEHSPHVVLLDIDLPDISGLDLCRRLRQNAATRLTPVIFITASDARALRIEGLEAGADDFLTKPVDTAELLARVRSLVRIKQYTDDLDSAASIILTLATMIESRDGYSPGHCHRMANYATSLGRAMKLDDGDLQALYRGGFLHDIGMLAISDSVLRRAGPLNPDEYELVKSHTVVGDALCSNLQSLRRVRPIVRSHHERLDGSGYPDRLVGDQIPLTAQIVGVVDVYEAVTTQRPYQDRREAQEAILLLRQHAERGWRRHDLVEAFVGLVQTEAAEPAVVHVLD